MESQFGLLCRSPVCGYDLLVLWAPLSCPHLFPIHGPEPTNKPLAAAGYVSTNDRDAGLGGNLRSRRASSHAPS